MTETPSKYGNSYTFITFLLDGGVVPKARPRVTNKGTFMPHRYQQWKRDAITDLTMQSIEMNLGQPLPAASVTINLVGKHPRRGDLDNLAGSVLDALVQAGVLKDDSVSVVSSLAIALHWSNAPPTVQIILSENQGMADAA